LCNPAYRHPQEGGEDELVQTSFEIFVDETKEQPLPSTKTFVRPKNLQPIDFEVDHATFDNPALEPKGAYDFGYTNKNRAIPDPLHMFPHK
jgi:hypothetical protein